MYAGTLVVTKQLMANLVISALSGDIRFTWCCSVLQTVCCSQCVAVSVLQSVCCSQCVAVSALQCVAVCCILCCSQCAAVSVLQSVCCSVLQ